MEVKEVRVIGAKLIGGVLYPIYEEVKKQEDKK